MTEKIIPDGYKLVAVKGLDELVYWLERCKDKGHLENCADLIEPFEAFEYRNVSEEAVIAAHEAKAAPAVPQGLPAFDELDDEVVDAACTVGSLYRVDLMFAYERIRAMLAATPAAPSQPVTLTLTHEEIRDALEAEFLGEASNRVWEDDLRISLSIIAALREKEQAT